MGRLVNGLSTRITSFLLLKLKLIKMQNNFLTRLLLNQWIRIIRNGIHIGAHTSERIQFSNPAEIFFILLFQNMFLRILGKPGRIKTLLPHNLTRLILLLLNSTELLFLLLLEVTEVFLEDLNVLYLDGVILLRIDNFKVVSFYQSFTSDLGSIDGLSLSWIIDVDSAFYRLLFIDLIHIIFKTLHILFGMTVNAAHFLALILSYRYECRNLLLVALAINSPLFQTLG